MAHKRDGSDLGSASRTREFCCGWQRRAETTVAGVLGHETASDRHVQVTAPAPLRSN